MELIARWTHPTIRIQYEGANEFDFST